MAVIQTFTALQVMQDAPVTEREANESLASGFLLPGDGSVN